MDLFSKDSHSIIQSNVQMRTDRTGRMQSSTGFNIQNQLNRTEQCNDLERTKSITSQHPHNKERGLYINYSTKKVNNTYSISSQFNQLMAPNYSWSPMDIPCGFSIQQTTSSHPQLQQGMATAATELNQPNLYQGSLGSSSKRAKRKTRGYDDSWTMPQQMPSLGNYELKGVFSPEMLDQLPMHSPQQNIWAYGPLKNSYLKLPAPSPARLSIPSVYDPMYQGMGLHPDPFLQVYDLKGMGNNIGRSNNNFTTATAYTNNNFYNSGSSSSNNNYTTEYNNHFPNTMSLPIQIPDSATSNEINYSYGHTSGPILPVAAEGMVGNTKLCNKSNQENEADDDNIFLPDDLLDLDGFEYNNTNENTDESVC